MERNLLLTMRFDGTCYHGFQVQKNARSVCEAFQDALEAVLGRRPDVKGCSRTDTGVHANKYCMSVKINEAIPCDKLVLALNSKLPDDIAVTGAKEAPLDFHARYSCTGKRYVYRILNSRIRNPFEAKYSYRYGFPLDADMLNREAGDFVGRHDFAAFCSRSGNNGDTVRTINSFTACRAGEMVLLTVCGDGFLYNMVRIMAGTLIYIAAGRIKAGSIPFIIESGDRGLAGKTMPAKGLFLDEVFYDIL